ncbi:MAG: hypothetical protein IGS48_13470 [Oscillatoriales cyanobacterium C42_A2020_001]|nr:hypothetical protein [Leptolyngbyaceae cyanobacterium C42_A2020_001]
MSKTSRQDLVQEMAVIETIYGAGFKASSSFYNKSTARLEVTPTNDKKGAKNIEIRFAIQPCWLGLVLVAATAQGICAIAFR